jgi:hypothetical protein
MLKLSEIRAAAFSSPDAGEYLALLVDGEPLDSVLDALVPGESLKGLIPAFPPRPRVKLACASPAVSRGSRFLLQCGGRRGAVRP